MKLFIINIYIPDVSFISPLLSCGAYPMAAAMLTRSDVSMDESYDLMIVSRDLWPVSFIISSILYPARFNVWMTVDRTENQKIL